MRVGGQHDGHGGGHERAPFLRSLARTSFGPVAASRPSASVRLSLTVSVAEQGRKENVDLGGTEAGVLAGPLPPPSPALFPDLFPAPACQQQLSQYQIIASSSSSSSLDGESTPRVNAEVPSDGASE